MAFFVLFVWRDMGTSPSSIRKTLLRWQDFFVGKEKKHGRLLLYTYYEQFERQKNNRTFEN